ncbi:UPF0187 protein [Smittium mucronatum]|uniref:UPF0187 protein n=1 Tax=Smittium mucronatum TaxID=133383 RepID=A0A1R0H5T6_9FUNG|nr:UPF0187 protein [Smittium mucronatum]
MVVFRTNTAYDRFWEGRKLVSVIESTITKVMRMFNVSIHPKTDKESEDRIQALKNIVAMAYSIKYYLLARPNYFNKKMETLFSQEILDMANENKGRHSIDERKIVVSDFEMRDHGIFSKNTFNLPITLSFELTNYLEYMDKSEIMPILYMGMYNSIGSIMDAFVGCIRIQTTPVPFAYSSHLHLVTALYLLSIPFSLNGYPVAITAVVQAIITFMLLGVLSIAEEIENPFGSDKNDLPISRYCDNLYEHLMFILDNQPLKKSLSGSTN